MKDCVFCNVNETIIRNKLSYAKYDKYPISNGHALIIPLRHVASYFDATLDEINAIQSLILDVKQIIQNKYSPDGFNIGINEGVAAGQTIPHLHVHIIPRYKNDIVDPRGGIRWIFPEKAKYWK